MAAEPRGGAARARPGARFMDAYAGLVVRLRWAVVLGWLTVAVGCVTLAPASAGGDGVDGFVPPDTPAIQTELREVRRFGFPLLSRVAVVQRDPEGLSPLTQAESLARAAAVTQGQYDDAGPILGAIPVPNTFGAFPGSRESGTTVITLLFMPPYVGFAEQTAAARDFVTNHYGPEDSVVGVTGSIPARVEQGRVLQTWLVTVETVTLAAIVLIVAVAFRSLLAPLLALIAAGTAIAVTLAVGEAVAARAGVPVPAELEPLFVALLLGVVTDYVIFYLFGLRQELAAGAARLVAARRSTARFTPIVTAAGVTVACGTGALLVARSALFQAFGPGMALAVLIGLLVAVTLTPALLAIFGPAAFWPSRPRSGGSEAARWAGRKRWVERLTQRRTAALVLTGCVAVLSLAALPVRHLDLGLSFVPSLPGDNSVRYAAAQAKAGFSEGIVSPTVLLLEGPDVTSQRVGLERLGELLAQRPGVAGVVGPGDQALPTELGIVLSRDGAAARYLLVLDDQPLGADAVGTLSDLRTDLPDLLAAAGLPDVAADLAGDTAIAAGVVARTTDDLKRITVAVLLANLVLLVVFLRALVAPLYLLAANVLGLAATLGLTTWVFQDLLGHDGLTFYVPFAAAVLLLALGSDYTIFSVGHVWAEAQRRPLRAALMTAMPQSTRAITAAGVTLAASFGLLGIVPLRPFRELAFAMAVGILLDAVVVRSLVVPTLLTLVGPASGWPGRRLRRTELAERPVRLELPPVIQAPSPPPRSLLAGAPLPDITRGAPAAHHRMPASGDDSHPRWWLAAAVAAVALAAWVWSRGPAAGRPRSAPR